MTQRDRSPRPGGAGFVLIGVVIFVLALTIIGISLFSLSSYEAQFLQRSIDREQAFQSAAGCGIERARFVLTLPDAQLDNVQDSLPPGVVRTVAIQGEDSTGAVDWGINADSVLIRVTAGRVGAQRVVEAYFRPVVTLNFYSSLITVSKGIEVEDESPLEPEDRDRTVLLDGPVWESSGDNPNRWLQHLLMPPDPDSIRTSPDVELPDVAPFLSPSGRLASAQPVVRFEPGPNSVSYTLDASGTSGVPGYFGPTDSDANFSLHSGMTNAFCTIQVRGLAVWLLPRGAMFYQGTTITGDPDTDCLVVIAGPMTGTVGYSSAPGPTSSICFLGYLRAQIPVILVSNGEVLLWHENDNNVDGFANDLAIFARSVRLMGPEVGAVPRALLQLHRNLDGVGPLNTLFLDALASQGALPNASSVGGRRLDLIPGTWHASDR
jgi:hypothetical protein